jgi:hypothetical protein
MIAAMVSLAKALKGDAAYIAENTEYQESNIG